MKIAILGAGAMGSVYGARMVAGGADITLLDVNDAHITAVRRDGLQVSQDEGTRRIAIPIMRPEEFSGRPDLILLFTKIFHTDAALRSVHALLDTTPVMSLQNGIGNVERLARHLPMDRIIIGMTMTPADYIGPGKVASHGSATTHFYSADGKSRPILADIAGTMRAGGIDARLDPDIQATIWEKAAFNCAMNALCALADATPGSIGASPDGRTLAFLVAQEAITVARTAGIAADFEKVSSLMQHAFANHLFHQASMLQDRKAGRRTEIDALSGAVSEMGARLNVPVPANTTIRQLVHLVEDTIKWRSNHTQDQRPPHGQ